MVETRDALYLYGFVPSGTPAPPADISGVDGTAVELLKLGPFAGVISRVPADRYNADSLAVRVREIDWMASRGLEHERVVTWFVDRGSILPVRVLTLYSSPEALKDEARARAQVIEEKLRRFRHLREWDLKVSYDLERLRERLGVLSGEIGSLEREIERAAPGKRYLLEKRRARRVREEAVEAARGVAQELMEGLAEMAVETRVLAPPQETEDLPVVLNAALLVAADRERDLWSEVKSRSEAMEPVGIRIRLSGPWAPYRFMDASDGREDQVG